VFGFRLSPRARKAEELEEYLLELLSSLPPWATLFIISFLASTIVPMGSEPYFLYLQNNLGVEFANELIIIAGLGNSLGSFTTFYLGRLGKLDHVRLKPYIPTLQKYGPLMAVFSPIPVVGDVVVAGLGFFRCNAFASLVLITLAKFTRYFLVSRAFDLFF
jgi:membrane protein YqaA with SNARE-associated domain